MTSGLSANTQAILLLTAPLLVGSGKPSVSPLSTREYRRLARQLRKLQHEPADLLDSDTRKILNDDNFVPVSSRLNQLLDRGFLLGLAMERWRNRAIWVASRADTDYPSRLKKRLKDDAPPILYGCGEASILNTGGLAVVGSRKVNDALIDYTEGVGRLSAASRCTLVSGGARGIDQAAMRGSLAAGGCVVGVLGDSLEKVVLRREHRDALIGGRLVLVCPYDPAAPFHVGHAMQRNKLIYALADAALVVNSDYERGGTWAGAVEQLDKLKLTPMYVRTKGETGKGLHELQKRGAKPWPDPETPEAFAEHLRPQPEQSVPVLEAGAPCQQRLPLNVPKDSASFGGKQPETPRMVTTVAAHRENSHAKDADSEKDTPQHPVPGAGHVNHSVLVPVGRRHMEGLPGNTSPMAQGVLPSPSIALSTEQKLARFLPGDFHQHNVTTLRQLCKANGLKGCSSLRKEELCQKLLDAGVVAPSPPLKSLSKGQLVALVEQLLV